MSRLKATLSIRGRRLIGIAAAVLAVGLTLAYLTLEVTRSRDAPDHLCTRTPAEGRERCSQC